MQPEARYRRIAESLGVFELTRVDDDDTVHVHDHGDDHTRFLNFYSIDGLKRAIAAYGIDTHLEKLGLGDFDLAVEREDPFRHRLHLFVGGQRDFDHTVMDLRLHLCSVDVPTEDSSWLSRITSADDEAKVRALLDEKRPRECARFDALVVDWLTLQNPRGGFTRARPRLPGQGYPGTGLGRAIHNLLMIMAWRVGREALVQTPARFHLAALYFRGGYRFASDARNRELSEVMDALRGLHFAAAAWAVEAGLVTRESDGAPFVYTPGQMLLPLSPNLKQSISDAGEAIRRALSWASSPRFIVDEGALKAWLEKNPVEGMDPTSITRGWF